MDSPHKHDTDSMHAPEHPGGPGNGPGPTLDPSELADLIYHVCDDIKGQDVVVLDVRPLTIVCDYFVIAHGLSLTHVQAIAEEIEDKLEEQGHRLQHRDRERDARWVVLDYGSVVVHVFSEEARGFYRLEDLWAKAPLVRRQEAEEAPE